MGTFLSFISLLLFLSCSKSDNSGRPKVETNTNPQTEETTGGTTTGGTTTGGTTTGGTTTGGTTTGGTTTGGTTTGGTTTGGTTTGGTIPPAVTIRVHAEFVDITDIVRIEKLKKAVALMERVLNMQVFRNRIRLYKYNDKLAFIDNDGKSNEEIMQTLKNGSELLRPGNDNTANLTLTLYYSRSSTVGYTTPQTQLIKINRKFFDQYNIAEVAGNLTHEWTHKIGFDHSSRYNEDRDHSVPYAVGYLMRDMGEDIIGEF